MESDKEIKSLKLYSVQGNLIYIKTQLKDKKKAILQIPQNLSAGVYYLFSNEEKISAVIIK